MQSKYVLEINFAARWEVFLTYRTAVASPGHPTPRSRWQMPEGGAEVGAELFAWLFFFLITEA